MSKADDKRAFALMTRWLGASGDKGMSIDDLCRRLQAAGWGGQAAANAVMRFHNQEKGQVEVINRETGKPVDKIQGIRYEPPAKPPLGMVKHFGSDVTARLVQGRELNDTTKKLIAAFEHIFGEAEAWIKLRDGFTADEGWRALSAHLTAEKTGEPARKIYDEMEAANIGCEIWAEPPEGLSRQARRRAQRKARR